MGAMGMVLDLWFLGTALTHNAAVSVVSTFWTCPWWAGSKNYLSCTFQLGLPLQIVIWIVLSHSGWKISWNSISPWPAHNKFKTHLKTTLVTPKTCQRNLLLFPGSLHQSWEMDLGRIFLTFWGSLSHGWHIRRRSELFVILPFCPYLPRTQDGASRTAEWGWSPWVNSFRSGSLLWEGSLSNDFSGLHCLTGSRKTASCLCS